MSAEILHTPNAPIEPRSVAGQAHAIVALVDGKLCGLISDLQDRRYPVEHVKLAAEVRTLLRLLALSIQAEEARRG